MNKKKSFMQIILTNRSQKDKKYNFFLFKDLYNYTNIECLSLKKQKKVKQKLI